MDNLVRVWEASTLTTKWFERRGAIDWERTKDFEVYVASIIKEVRERGDLALVEFVKRFDKVDLTPERFCVTRDEIDNAYGSVKEEQIATLKFLKERVENFERRLLERIKIVFEEETLKVKSLVRPIQTVGCYVPGGEAAYPSTLIMTVTPAKVAGVSRVAVCSPPGRDGLINPLTLVAADLCKADEIYKLGGAHAIAALAYGTESINRVRKIVGPGNKYVTMAKLLVSSVVAIDLPAGPSEILVLADETADPRIVALDMVSQAEHSADSVAGLVTNSKELAICVSEELRKMVPSLHRNKVITEALSKNGFMVICENMSEAIDFTNKFAPEHLEVLTEQPMEIVDKITSAGLILMGAYAPVAASDYCIGTNHNLPTSGFGRVFSGLSIIDFVKRINCIDVSKEGLLKFKENIRILAEAENLPNHFLAVEGRFKL